MATGQSFYSKLLSDFEPQLSYLYEKTNSLNRALTDSYSPLQLVAIASVLTACGISIYQFLFSNDEDIQTRVKQTIFRLARHLPIVQREIAKARNNTLKSIYADMEKSIEGHQFAQALPERSISKDEIIKKLHTYRNFEKINYSSGHVSGCVYKVTKADLTEIYNTIFDLFGEANPLHADVFPDIRTMEAEVVRCIATMFHGDKNVCGTMTSGGTESLLMACKTYRDIAIAKGIKRPEIVMPVTAHPAFNKASFYFKMKLIRVPVDPNTLEVDIKQMRRAITKNTCMIVASAPCFPHGTIDPIQDISKIAVEYGVPLHVDGCLGGFLIAFMDKAGFPLKPFDFRVPGVMSISCDSHKYGFTPKGASVILYRTSEICSHQFYALADWPGGIYASPSIAGSRSGFLIACCWATLMYYGLDGYVEETRKIIQATRALAQGWSKIDGLYLLHNPDVSVVAVGSKAFNIYYVLDGLRERGWHLNGLQNPAGLHIALTQLHTLPGVIEKLIEETRECVAEVMKRDNTNDTPTAVIYGTNQKVPDKSIVCDMAKLYIGACYNTTIPSSSAKNAH
ncbi:unnamed protein product [Rotaria magnacalcarata]|uniref:sphinganine-1-phosphate aldolase n=1 Tax=Rotaria magnacalcarata TaxID=392030 RepID=A0A815XVE5_9BILA|nr:unnamed protein product [Rotaria magnacalcarata]